MGFRPPFLARDKKLSPENSLSHPIGIAHTKMDVVFGHSMIDKTQLWVYVYYKHLFREVSMPSHIISGLIGIVSALVTIILTPRLQHYFWGYQRMSELRLSAFKDLNRLAAQFIYNYNQDPKFRPTKEFFNELTMTSADIKILFSETAFNLYREFEYMIGPGLGPNGKGTLQGLIERRDTALKALYGEAVAAKLF